VTWLLDLDGVIWLADEPIPGAAEAVATLRAHGHRTVFVTNNSSPKVADYLAKLAGFGVPTEPEDLLTSAQAAASLVKPGATALVCAGPGVEEALRARQVETIRRGRADAVVVGWHRDFDFERLTAAFEAVHGGAPLVGTNDDATYPTPGGLLPGGGAILAAVAYASGATPTVAGKPYEAMVALAHERVADPVMMVGDRPSTDGLFANRLGVPFGLVLSGVTKASAPELEPAPDRVANDLAELVAQTYA
jgi:HAD superfamily hydrolase (TIGR01450 family)